jgi:molecular chaperone DnaJ
MTTKRCYYEVLGVTRGAAPGDLKAAYRRQAKECHPDRNGDDPDAERRFKELNEAYDVLKDDQKRAAYDQFGHAAFENGRGPGGGFGSEFGFGASFSDVFDDLFGDFMGSRSGRGRNRGSDVRFNLTITLEDAFNGKKTDIRVPASMQCEDCKGSGAAPGTQPVTCPTCQGHGKVRASQGFFTIERTCITCHGQGRVIKEPCGTCNGAGRMQRDKTLTVNIPQGVEDGTRIRLAGEGEAGVRGGPAGDLYIFLTIAKHDLFQRDGMDLFCRVPVSFSTAALGGPIEVPVVGGGRGRVQVPDGTQSGKSFRLRGKGMPGLRGQGRGDLYVQVVVETPVKLTRKQKELLKEFDSASSEQNTPETSGFFSRVKEFWEEFKD